MFNTVFPVWIDMKKRWLNRPVVNWALYDWANSAFATTVMAGFFPAFYGVLSAEISTRDSQFWFNITLAVSSLLIALAAPLLGAIADSGGSKKKFLAGFALLGILMCVGLAWVSAGMWWVGLALYGFGLIGFSGANIFYDSLMIVISPEEEFDVVSGFGYALGYLGGGLLFLVNVLMVTYPDWFGLQDTASAVSISFISVAIWWAVFTLPLLMGVKEPPVVKRVSMLQVAREGLGQLQLTFREIRKLKMLMWFLAGYWFYIDGVGTIIKTAVFFANRVLGLPYESLITALLLTQFVAFPAAIGFGWIGKKTGPRAGILIGLIVYVLVVLYAWLWLDSTTDFYLLAIAIGLVQGGVQSLSRSLFARLIPKAKTAEFFGFFNMVGKFASILGPALMAVVPFVFAGAAERDSIVVLIVLFVVGALFLWKVDVSEGMRVARQLDDQWTLSTHTQSRQSVT